MKTIHKTYCSKCKQTGMPMCKISSRICKGVKTQYYRCRACIRDKMKKYYATLTGEKKARFHEMSNRWNRKQAELKKV